MEKNIRYKIIFSDLDETLLVNHHIPKVNLDAINSMKDTHFVVCTGRPYETAYQILKELGTYDLKDHYTVCLNGGLIIENKDCRIIKETGFSYEEVSRIMEYGRDLDVCVMAFSATDIFMFKASKEEIERKYEQKARFEIIDDYEYDFLRNHTIIKMIYENLDFDYLKNIECSLDESFKSLFQISYSSYRYLEFNPLGVSKGQAVRFLSHYLGIDVSETIAIGDNYNDTSMLLAAGLGVCVQDGIIKEYADYVCERGFRDGAVAEVIDRFIMGSEEDEV